MFLKATNASSDFRLSERARSVAFVAKRQRGPGKRVPQGTLKMRVGDPATSPPPPQREVNAPHPRHQGNSAIRHLGARFRIPSYRTQNRGVSQPGRRDSEASHKPPSLGCGVRQGRRPLCRPGVRNSATHSNAAAPGSSWPHVAAVIAPDGIPPRPSRSVSLSLAGTLRVGAPRKDRTHALAHAPPKRRRAVETVVRSSRRCSRWYSSSAASRRWLVSPAVAGGRAAGPGAPRSLSLTTVPASSRRSSSGRGAVGACAEPPPPRPRPASTRAAAAARDRRRRRRCACCSSPSPLQCEGLEDGRLAELRG